LIERILGIIMSNAHDEMVALQAKRAAIDAKMLDLEAERARVDERVKEAGGVVNRADLPCWQCDHPEARDVRHWLGCNYNPAAGGFTQSGLPLACCRLQRFQRNWY
jgi:hypothetical protein